MLPLQLLQLPATAHLLGELTRYTERKGTLCMDPAFRKLHACGSDQAESPLSHHAVAAVEQKSSCSKLCVIAMYQSINSMFREQPMATGMGQYNQGFVTSWNLRRHFQAFNA
jgi:hypothetical protein